MINSAEIPPDDFSDLDRLDTLVNKDADRAVVEIVWDSIRPVANALGGLFLLFAIAHLFLLPAQIKVFMSAMAGSTALIIWGIGRFTRLNPFSERLTYPLSFALIALAIINSLLHLFLTDDILQTTNLLLIIFGTGFFIISRRWFFMTLALTLLGWMVYALASPPKESALHFGIALFSASLVAIVINFVRNRTIVQTERLRILGEYQRIKLENTLLATAEAQERYQRLTEATFDGIVIQAKGTIIDANESFTQMFGYSADEIQGKSVLDFIALDDQTRTLNYMRWGHEQSYEINGVKKDGTNFPIELTAREISHKGRKLRVVVFRDLTEFRAAQQERDRFFNLSIDMLAIAGFDGFFKHLSPSFEDILGHTYPEMLAKPFLDFVHPKDREATGRMIQAIISGADLLAFENRFLTQAGSYKWILWNATPFQEAGLIYAIGRDITTQKENLLELQEREQRMQAILNTTVDGIIVINEFGIIQSFNRAASLIFGYTEDEVIGQNVRLLMPEPYHGEHDGYVGAYMHTREPKIIGKGREVKGRRKNGEIFPLALAVSNVELPGRTLFTGIIRDITERVQAETAHDRPAKDCKARSTWPFKSNPA